jgi:hypothetical protein
MLSLAVGLCTFFVPASGLRTYLLRKPQRSRRVRRCIDNSICIVHSQPSRIDGKKSSVWCRLWLVFAHFVHGACWLRFMTLSPILLFASVAFATDTRPSCEMAKESIVSRSSSGLAQVSNLGGVHITCHVPARPFPTTPGGEPRYMLKVATNAYEISADGTKKLVPSEVHVGGGGGGGFGPDPKPEWVDFDVLIPLDSTELDAEVHRYLAKLEESMTPEQKAQLAALPREKALENIRQFVYQNRLGHFQLDCRVLDGSSLMGTDNVEFEVLFKGRFSDVGLPGFSPA